MVENFSPRPLWRKAAFRRTALTLAAFAVAAVFAGPFLWMILTSLKGPKEIFVTPVRLFPTMGWYWQAYLEVWQKGNFSRYFLNSVFVASATTAISVLISVMAGLGFARYKLPGRNWLMLCILVS